MKSMAHSVAMPTQIASLANQAALSYRNDRIVERLAKEGQMSKEDAETLFEDTLKFLALTGNGIKLSPSAPIDLGWHNFILHTREYAEFCEQSFGRFIHHEPGSGLIHKGVMLDVAETAEYARSIYGDISKNWEPTAHGRTCGSGGC